MITFASAIHFNPNSKHNSFRDKKIKLEEKKENYLYSNREHDNCIS